MGRRPRQKLLLRLSPQAALIRKLGVKGNHQGFDALVADVKRHALTLNLLGTCLRDAHEGDIRLFGLFDRPTTTDCPEALWRAAATSGLTESILGLTERQRNIAFRRLEDATLITMNREAANRLVTPDSHALIREYFANTRASSS